MFVILNNTDYRYVLMDQYKLPAVSGHMVCLSANQLLLELQNPDEYLVVTAGFASLNELIFLMPEWILLLQEPILVEPKILLTII